MARNRYLKGFTLLELLVAVALVALLASVGLPNFIRMVEVSRVVSATNEFKTALNYARSEAVRRNTSITLKPMNIDVGWEAGWELSESGPAPRQWPQDANNLQVTMTNETLVFSSLGRLPVGSSTVWISIERGSEGRCIRLERSGLSRVQDIPAPCATQ